MFYDERINYECGKIYRWGICGAAKVFLITGLAGYAVSVPISWSRPVDDLPVNFLIIFLEVIGAIYLFYSFKTREINFNYTVIGEDKKTYYFRVYKNMGKLSGILFIAFLFASTLGIMLHGSVLQFIGIWLAYLWSCVGLSLEYLFISWIEKRSYDEETQSGLKKATVIAGIAMLISRLMDLGQRLFVEVAGEAAMQCYAEHVNYFSFGMTVIYFILICKAIKGLIDEFQATRMLWILPAVCVAAFVLKLFLVSQSFLVIATAVQEVMILMSIACGLWMLRKRVHFGLCDGGRGNAPLRHWFANTEGSI